VSVTLPVTEQLTQVDTSTTQVVVLQGEVLQVTESMQVVASYTPEEDLIQVDASTVTCNTTDVVTLALSESNTVTGNMVETGVTSLIEVVTTSDVVTFNVTPETIQDVTTFVAVATPIDVTPTDETIHVTGVLPVTETMLLLDVTTLTGVTTESNTLSQAEGTAYVTTLAPVTVTSSREVLLVTDQVVTEDDDVTADFLAPGYTLQDTPLSVVETIAVTRQSFIKTFGVIRTGQVDGIIRTGQVTGVVRTGLVDGVIQ
jgi:hypothetical protein